MANVTITNLAASAKSFYEKRLLMRAVPRMVHTRFAEKASINGYNALEWRRYAALSAVTSALTEGTTPTEETQPSLTQVTATPQTQYLH